LCGFERRRFAGLADEFKAADSAVRDQDERLAEQGFMDRRR